jgi:hypothetical protein
MRDTGQEFGCERCWPSAADAAWEARAALTHVADLIDESHFHVMILACPRCAQRFVSVFTETIDWVNGDDPQDSTLLPITEAEDADLVQRREALTEKDLNWVGSRRRSLRRDRPSGPAQRIFWGTGIAVGPHD